MVARKRNRSSLRLSILERHTQRRIQSIGATTGCRIFAVEKDTSLNRLSEDSTPSITIINSERSLSQSEIECLPQKTQLLYLAEAPDKASPLQYLKHYEKFDSTVLMRDNNIDASTFVQSLLYGMAQKSSSLLTVRFSRWGAARKHWQDLPFSQWQLEIGCFTSELDLPKDVNKRHVRFLHQIESHIEDTASLGQVIMASDGVNIILKVRGKFKNAKELIPKILKLPALAAAVSFDGEYTELMLIQRQRPSRAGQKGVKILLVYSPRFAGDNTSLEEAG